MRFAPSSKVGRRSGVQVGGGRTLLAWRRVEVRDGQGGGEAGDGKEYRSVRGRQGVAEQQGAKGVEEKGRVAVYRENGESGKGDI